MDKLKMQSKDIVSKNIDRLSKLFPNCVTESESGKVIDFEQLKQELSIDLIEGNKERYRIEWPGKKEAIVTANLPTSKTLRPIKEDSVDFDNTENIYIEGDNLEVLKILQESYLNKIKMIFIDPPYNTGNDFIYRDNFTKDKSKELFESGQKDELGQRLVVNAETSGRYHSDWLSMMYPRLKLARNLLINGGVIFISIDDNEIGNLKKICDEIFGEENFIEIFTWHKKNSAKGVPTRNMVVNIHEYILCYSKNQDARLFGEKRTEDTFSNPDNDSRGLWRRSNIKSTLERSNDSFTIIDPVSGNKFTNFWAFSKDTLQKMIDEGRILFPNDTEGLPKQKEFLNEFENPNMPIKSHLGLFHAQDTSEKEIDEMMGQKVFLYRKPLDLIKKIVEQAGIEKDQIILDFFSGSATTAHAVMQINAEDQGSRKYILVQLPEETDKNSEAYKAGYKNICEIGKERIRRAAKKIKEEANANCDYGFRVYRLDESNMHDVYYHPQDYDQSKIDMFADNVKSDRTADDLLAQVMLDWGLPLNLKIEQVEIADKQVYKVDDDSLYACFDKGLDENFAKEIAKNKPLRIVFRDHSFKDNSAKTNVKQLLKQLSPETEMKVI